MRKSSAALLVLVVLDCAFAQSPALPWRSVVSEPDYLRGVITVPADRLSPALMDDIGRAALVQAHGRQLVYAELYPEDAFPPPHYLMLSHSGYEWWRLNYERTKRHPAGRMISLRGNAIAEFTNGSGEVTRHILAGSDPLNVSVAEGNFTLLQFTFRPVPLARENGLAAETVDIYATTEVPLCTSGGIALLKALHSLVPIDGITLFIRNDTWFLDHSDYPVEHPFQPRRPPPTKDEFLRSLTLECGGMSQERYNCSFASGR